MNKLSECHRIRFYINRDGAPAAINKVEELKQIYRSAAKKTRSHGSKNHPYRSTYVVAAMSCRYLQRTNFVMQVMLLELMKLNAVTNAPGGSSVCKSVIHHLKRNEIDLAKIVAECDFDKVTQYPAIAAAFKKYKLVEADR